MSTTLCFDEPEMHAGDCDMQEIVKDIPPFVCHSYVRISIMAVPHMYICERTGTVLCTIHSLQLFTSLVAAYS